MNINILSTPLSIRLPLCIYPQLHVHIAIVRIVYRFYSDLWIAHNNDQVNLNNSLSLKSKRCLPKTWFYLRYSFRDNGTSRYDDTVSLTQRDRSRGMRNVVASWETHWKVRRIQCAVNDRTCRRKVIMDGKSGARASASLRCLGFSCKLSLLSWLFTPPSSTGSTRETRRREAAIRPHDRN